MPLRPQRTLVLRPHIEILEKNAQGVKALPATADEVEIGVRGVLDRALEEKGIAPVIDPIARLEWEERSPNKEAIASIQKAFDSLQAKAAKMAAVWPAKVYREFSVADDLILLKRTSDFDTLVLTRGRGLIPTKAAKAISAIPLPNNQIQLSNSLDLTVAVLDARSGSLLHLCKISAKGDYVGDPDVLAGPLAKCLKKLPGPAAQTPP